jgi:hypothetical protein
MALRFLRHSVHLSQRIYVHESVYDDFVTQYVDLVKVTVLSGLLIPAVLIFHAKEICPG